MGELADILQKFSPISLEEMKAVKLMNRIDTKYLVARERLPEILSRLTGHFYVQELASHRIAHYHTLYYDTTDVQMYHLLRNQHRFLRNQNQKQQKTHQEKTGRAELV